MEASAEWPPLWIPNAKRPWKRVYDTLACLKNYLLFSLCILACSPLSLVCSLLYRLQIFLLHPCLLLFVSLYVSFRTFRHRIFLRFLSVSYFSPPCCTRCLPIIPFPFVSFSFPPNRTFPPCRTFIPWLCRTFFLSVVYLFPQSFSRFPKKSTIF